MNFLTIFLTARKNIIQINNLLSFFMFVVIFFTHSLLTSANALALSEIGAAIAVTFDGTNPTKDTGAAGGTTGDDASLNNGIVRTSDYATFTPEFSINEDDAQNVVLTLAISDQAIFDVLSNMPILDTLCDTHSYNAQSTLLSCHITSVMAGITQSIPLSVIVKSGAVNNATFDLTYSVSAANGIPNPSAAECSQDILNLIGCTVVSDSLTVSAALSADFLKTSQLGTVAAVYDVARAGWVVTFGLALRNTDISGDNRGSAELDETSIGVLSDWITARNPTTGVSFVPNTTLEGCRAGQFSSRGIQTQPGPITRDITANPLVNVTNSLTNADWACATTGINAFTFSVSNIDFDRITPYITRTGILLPDDLLGFLATAQYSIFVPLSDVVNNGGLVVFRNCAATPVGDDTISEFTPTDLAGTPNQIVDDPADNCAVIALATSDGNLNGGKDYNPPARLNEVVQVLDGAEIKAQLFMFNSAPPPATSITNPVICDKFDNRTQSLRGAVEFLATNILPDSSATVVYGVGPWGLASGIPYVQNTPDSSWYVQSTSDCSDTAISAWYTESQIDFTNSGIASVNAADINVVRVSYTGALEARVGRIDAFIPLTILDRDSADWHVNYSALFNQGRGWQVFSCFGIDHSTMTCPNQPVLSRDRPGQRADSLLHTDAVIRVEKDLIGPRARQGGDIVTFELKPLTVLLSSVDFDFSPGAEINSTNVIVSDYLPPYLTYIPGTSFLNEDVDGDGVLDLHEDWNLNGVLDIAIAFDPFFVGISTNAADFNIPNIGQQLIQWNLGDLPFGTEGPLITFDVEVDSFTPNNSTLTNYVVIDADNSSLPIHCLGEKCAFASIVVASPAAAQVIKESSEKLVDFGDSISYTLSYGNISPEPIEIMDVVDIFPHPNDPNGSVINGALSILSASNESGGNPIEIWASRIPSSELDVRGGSLLNGTLEPVLAYGGLGNELGVDDSGDNIIDWPCLLSDVGAFGCAIASLNEVTAIRVLGDDPNPTASGPGDSFLDAGEGPYSFVLTFSTVNSSHGDEFVNCYGGNFESLQLSVFNCDVAPVKIFNGAIGDLVFFDNDQNGLYDVSIDESKSGVLINLLDSAGNPVDDPANPGTAYQVTTNGDGRYLFVGLSRGDYIIEIDPSNFGDGAVLDHVRVSPYAISSDPNDDENETIDHDALGDVVSGVQTGVIALNTNEPLMDDVDSILPAIIPDEWANQTIDFAFEPLGSIGNYLWFDENGNGLQDETGTGIAGITVILTYPDGSTLTMTTDVAGAYLFDDLTPGNYIVRYDETTLPALGCSFGQCVQSTLALPGQDFGNQMQNYPIALGVGEYNPTADFGFWRPISTASSFDYGRVTMLGGDQLEFEFATSSEISTIGFNIYAIVYRGTKQPPVLKRVGELIEAKGHINQGRVYRVTSSFAGVAGFMIQDQSADGQRIYAGPYWRGVSGMSELGKERVRSRLTTKRNWAQRSTERDTSEIIRTINRQQ